MPDRRPAMFAEADAVADAARDMPDEFLECRDYRHAWRPLNATATPEGFLRSRQCGRCLTVRHEELTPRGGIIRSWYDYADGYQLHGLGRIAGSSADALRLASITRMIERNQLAAGNRRRRKAS